MGLMSLKSRPFAVSAAGAVGVLLLHAVLVISFVLSLSLPSTRRPNTTGTGASAFVSAAESDMTVVFIDEPTPAEDTAPPRSPSLASRGIMQPDEQLVVLGPDPSPAGTNVETADSEDAVSDTASGDAAEHARLYGRYLGQLEARIERAWMRPRSEIGAPRFSCRARIRQDRRGAVAEASLDHCNGTERWQQSLLSAIRTASPLPAPPDASVYADVLLLSFASEAFVEGGSLQGFEPESRLADAHDRSALESFQRFASGTQSDYRSDDKAGTVVHLTIIGMPADHSAPAPSPAPVEPLAAPSLESQSAEPLPQ